MHLHHQSPALGKRPFLPHPASQARGPLLHATGQASYPQQATKRIQVAPREPGWGVIQPTNQALISSRRLLSSHTRRNPPSPPPRLRLQVQAWCLLPRRPHREPCPQAAWRQFHACLHRPRLPELTAFCAGDAAALAGLVFGLKQRPRSSNSMPWPPTSATPCPVPTVQD